MSGYLCTAHGLISLSPFLPYRHDYIALEAIGRLLGIQKRTGGTPNLHKTFLVSTNGSMDIR